MASLSVNPQDTHFLHAAPHNWQERNRTARTVLALSPAERKTAMTITKREMCLILAGALLIGYMVRFLHTVPAPYVPYTVQEAKCESQAWDDDARYMEQNGIDSGDPYVNPLDYPKTRHEARVRACMIAAPKKVAAMFTKISVAHVQSARCDARGMEAVHAAQKLAKDQGFGMFQADGDTIYQNGSYDCR